MRTVTRRNTSWAVFGVLACLALAGCGLENETGRMYYVPIEQGSAYPAPTQSGGSPSAVLSPSDISPTPSQTFSPAPGPIVASGWKDTCSALDKFKATYQSTFTFSAEALEEAAQSAPSGAVKDGLRFLAEELVDSQERFSYALLSPVGVEVGASVERVCGDKFAIGATRP
jgi:hypothetical protein